MTSTQLVQGNFDNILVIITLTRITNDLWCNMIPLDIVYRQPNSVWLTFKRFQIDDIPKGVRFIEIFKFQKLWREYNPPEPLYSNL